jgi:hypothetical protein
MKTSLSQRASFKLGLPKRTWDLLVIYLEKFVKYGWVEVVCVKETPDSLVWWMKNGIGFYRLEVGCRSDVVELCEVYFSARWAQMVQVSLEKGPGGRRKTYMRMLRRMMWSRKKGRSGKELIKWQGYR